MTEPRIFIESERIYLREILAADEKDLFELDHDPEVHRFLGNRPLKTIEEARAVIEFIRRQYIENGIGRWAIIEKQSGEFIGWSGLKLVREETNSHVDFYDVGYRLKRKHWGKGFATEACKASLEYGFKKMDLREIFASADAEHQKSIHVLEKCGLNFVNAYLHEGRKTNWYRISYRDDADAQRT